MKNRIWLKKGQMTVEYAILIFFCVIVFIFQTTVILDILDDYAQGFYYMLQLPWP